VLLTPTGLKPGHCTVPAQMMANNVTHFDRLAKHSPVNGEEYAAMLSVLIKKFKRSHIPLFFLALFLFLVSLIKTI